MSFTARWIINVPACGLYTARRLLAGATPVDRPLADALAPEAAGLADDLETTGIEPAKFFEHAIGLSARFDSPAHLAEVVLAKIYGPQQHQPEAIVRRLVSLSRAVLRAKAELLEELELRSRPLRDAWEARGAGLLAGTRRLTADDVVVEAASVVLVPPVFGGGGMAHPLYNAVSFEGVLANPVAELPEVVRLAWLWAQLNLDLPRYEELAGRAALGRVGPLALLPPVLAAATDVELAQFDRPLLETALAAWGLGDADAETLYRWWETYRSSETSWAAALVALAKMFCEA